MKTERIPSLTRKLLPLWGALTLGLLGSAAHAAPPTYGGTISNTDLMDVDLMFIGAHPDDDGGIMGTFSRYLLDGGLKGTVVTLTGGEGGGNATGRETGRPLGLIREEEERRSLNMIGVTSPHFLGLRDFYFTLSAEETQEKWGGQAFVCDVVRLVRLRKPEVLVTMWPGPGTHGQHQNAARAATLAFQKAGDSAYCPEQITQEGLQAFSPLKLYYYPNSAADATVSVPTDDVSRSARVRYADLKSMALMNYRTQGFDVGRTVPDKTAAPETFMLIRSRVPTPAKETGLLAGAFEPSGTSPLGVRLEAVPASFEAGVGVGTTVEVRFTNQTAAPMRALQLKLGTPAGWTATRQGAAAPAEIQPGQTVTQTFKVTPAAQALTAGTAALSVDYTAQAGTQAVAGSSVTRLKPVSAVSASFVPTFDVAGYQAFARDTETEWVIGSLPTRLPLVLGQATPVGVRITNRGTTEASGDLKLTLPAGVSVEGDLHYRVAAGQTLELPVRVKVEAAALPADRHSAQIPITVSTAGGTADQANAFVLPALTIPKVTAAPVIDGDLSDMASLAAGTIGPKDLWWKAEPASPADASADFRIGYDADYLYVGLHVRDDAVICNIAPDDIKAQLRSDAVGITVDPGGAAPSRDTGTTLQAAAFPCTTAGFQARGFRDADARQGLMEVTAPGMQVASRKEADGYSMEYRLPWAAMPRQPKTGDTIGLNVVLYDGDQKDARVGANISESGLAWAAFQWGGKQALPYLWPRVLLGP